MTSKLKTDAEHTINHSLTDLKDKLLGIADKITNSYQDNSEKIKDKASELKDKACDVNDNLIDYVQKNPWKAIGISIAAGVILSKVFSFRR